jgi:phospholipid transport system substrate-binding protein
MTSPKLTRRVLLASGAAFAACAALFSFSDAAAAQSTDAASSFVAHTANELTGIVNGGGSAAQKRDGLQRIIDRDVDVADVARFCLGRFWRTATPDQQREYVELFHRVLVLNITGKVGEYQGVTIAMGRSAPREGDISVSTTVTRPGNQPSRVDWLVSTASGSPKIIDVVAEGTSLRLTQRSDYASYLAHNNNDVSALIGAMRQQANQKPS